jgi:hypothetical protein
VGQRNPASSTNKHSSAWSAIIEVAPEMQDEFCWQQRCLAFGGRTGAATDSHEPLNDQDPAAPEGE